MTHPLQNVQRTFTDERKTSCSRNLLIHSVLVCTFMIAVSPPIPNSCVSLICHHWLQLDSYPWKHVEDDDLNDLHDFRLWIFFGIQ